jgi:hypothetical protein
LIERNRIKAVCQRIKDNLNLLSWRKLTVVILILSGCVYLGISQQKRLSKAWDGSGHNLATGYFSSAIFPEASGWLFNQIGGEPFPNFYPPLFYFLTAIVSYLGFTDPIKFFVILFLIAVPAGIWRLGRIASKKNGLIPAAGAVAFVLLLLFDYRFTLRLPAGLDSYSTLQIGLYTHPLGFLLLTLWAGSYLDEEHSSRKIISSSALLAVTILASFFAAVTAAVFIVAALAVTVVGLIRRKREPRIYTDATDQRGLSVTIRRICVNPRFRKQIITPVVALLLVAFWLAPMARDYDYFVTRTHSIQIGDYLTPILWFWVAVAVIGFALWGKRSTPSFLPYLLTCLMLAGGLLFSSFLSPAWFPMQGPRFLIVLIFLLSVPIGFALAAAFRGVARLLGELNSRRQEATLRRTRYTTGVAIFIVLCVFATSSGTGVTHSFYPPAGEPDVNAILQFGRDHRDGRYLVELPSPRDYVAQLDSRAVSAYLAMQGNETLYGVFHEASVNSLFFLPVINAFSAYPYHFGISSILGDDIDFAQQPLAKHIERARRIGAKYLVIFTPIMKERLANEPSVGRRHDFGRWSVFEISTARGSERGAANRPIDSRPLATPRGTETLAQVEILPYRPALLVSEFTVKERRRNEHNFIRFVEEQFADGWFDVLLARSPETEIDRLTDLDRFGALIVDAYKYDDEEAAYQKLREFSRQSLLVMLASQDRLYQRVKENRGEFQYLETVERPQVEPGERVNTLEPTYRYSNSPLRQEWLSIRAALDKHKVPVSGSDSSSVSRSFSHRPPRIAVDYKSSNDGVEAPILIATTFHPRWRREDGGKIYASTPFYVLTFTDRPVSLRFGRDWYDVVALWVSGATLLALMGHSLWNSYSSGMIGKLIRRPPINAT